MSCDRARTRSSPSSQWLPQPDDERVRPAHARRRADAAGTRGAVRNRRHPVGRRPSPVPTGGVPAGGDLGGRPVRRRRLRRHSARRDTRRKQRGDRVATVRRPGRPHGVALRPLRRAAPSERGRLAHAAVPPHRGGRPLVRPRCSRLQGQPPHAPRCPARARRRRSRQPQTGRRGIRGTGHRRARGVRPGPRRSPARGRHRRRRHRQRCGRPPRGHLEPARQRQRRRDRRGAHLASCTPAYSAVPRPTPSPPSSPSWRPSATNSATPLSTA